MKKAARPQTIAAPRPVRVWRQRGILMLLFTVFLTSGLLRIGQMDFALAATGDEGHDPMAADAGADTMGQDDHGDMAAAACPTVASVEAALAAIDGRAEDLAAWEARIADRQSRLDAADELVSARLAELEAAEARLSQLLSVADSAAAEDLDRLTRFYETMDADNAAALFAQMDPNFAAGFLARMRAEAGAGILAELPPELAYAISVILATRNADVPVSAAGLTAAPADAP